MAYVEIFDCVLCFLIAHVNRNGHILEWNIVKRNDYIGFIAEDYLTSLINDRWGLIMIVGVGDVIIIIIILFGN